MATDWTCAIVPSFIVSGFQMPRRQKVSVCAVLSLGVFASIATCIRLFKFYYGTSHDANYKIAGDSFQQSQNVLASSGPAIKLGSINDHDRTYNASAKRTPSGPGELEVDDDDSSGKGIMRKTEINISSSTSRG
ncbi:integral membrane protein [Colletotrichum plurivorum]|uniref:Integral membrane protein n=1 Tax=Colletotrichum plurivorum TaxID=2175906 RepID=A0A8H6MUE0_9PEZI|nr:integral membrane protein [Colletotrichum plurivorum]